jgi:hypothetical protein
VSCRTSRAWREFPLATRPPSAAHAPARPDARQQAADGIATALPLAQEASGKCRPGESRLRLRRGQAPAAIVTGTAGRRPFVLSICHVMVGRVRSLDPTVEIAAKPTWPVRGSRTKSALATAFISVPPRGSFWAVVMAPFSFGRVTKPFITQRQRSPYLYVRKRVHLISASTPVMRHSVGGC